MQKCRNIVLDIVDSHFLMTPVVATANKAAILTAVLQLQLEVFTHPVMTAASKVTRNFGLGVFHS